jgi:hypothetical protein
VHSFKDQGVSQVGYFIVVTTATTTTRTTKNWNALVMVMANKTDDNSKLTVGRKDGVGVFKSRATQQVLKALGWDLEVRAKIGPLCLEVLLDVWRHQSTDSQIR